ncbi:hypothetical protein [Aeromicrobium stalagmiti]|uniref:hypothetical protein n=1 Tax=Aeromicrobium stalagmiti TaxID=2738988 RepID=UPI001568798C|nr:hypothetical protein [Aeromicrobium stalagmiti]NRQ50765.1 hypothetical protein [Aeromicrobium stalagmiti]
MILLAALCIVVVATAIVVTRGTTDDGPALVSEADGSTSATLGSVDAKEYRSAYFGSVCVSGPGKVTIRSIAPIDPQGGLKVTDFSVVTRRDDAALLGASNGRLRDEPSFQGGHTVTTTCPGEPYAELFVEVYKPGLADTGAHEFTITYDSDGDTRSTKLRFGFGLCTSNTCDVA